jgi:DNA-binding XRE family transcriptional regulator
VVLIVSTESLYPTQEVVVPNPNHFAQDVRAARKRLGWSQTRLAEALRPPVTTQAISYVERADRAATPALALALCKALKLHRGAMFTAALEYAAERVAKATDRDADEVFAELFAEQSE